MEKKLKEKIILNRPKYYSKLLKCPYCEALWFSISVRRFVKCLVCEKKVFIPQNTLYQVTNTNISLDLNTIINKI